ncbi:MAG: sulfur oxidation c-type cytochrome SoxX [Geminicoccaceae bacterium]
MSGSAAGAPGDVAEYQIVDGGITAPLTDQPGDPDAGREAFIDRDGGHCLLCHAVSSLDEPFQGTLGPDLSDFGSRMDLAETRLRLVDATELNPETVMPAYHRTRGLRQVQTMFQGKPVLSAQAVENILSYLTTLKTED